MCAPVLNPQVTILKRGEKLPKETADLEPTHRIEPNLVSIPTQIRLDNCKSEVVPLYAGSATTNSPPPSDLPLPGFFITKKRDSLLQASDATKDLIRILRLDTA